MGSSYRRDLGSFPYRTSRLRPSRLGTLYDNLIGRTKDTTARNFDTLEKKPIRFTIVIKIRPIVVNFGTVKINHGVGKGDKSPFKCIGSNMKLN